MKKTTKIFGLLLTLFGLALVTGCTPITDTPEVPEETTYTVTIASDIAKGTVTADKTSAKAGETVKLTAIPDSGYELDTFYVNDNAITGGTFTMPAENVTVSVTFKETAETRSRKEVEAVIAEINKIGIVEYTAESKTLIDNARKAYDDLTDEQKALVTNYEVLTTAEKSYSDLKTTVDNQDAAADVITKINAIGTVVYTDICKAKIDAARNAYNALTSDQKVLVTNYSTLTTAESTYASLIPYTIVINAITNGTVSTDTSAKAGETVTLTINPATGYELATLSVKNGDSVIDVNGTGNTRTFTMPAGNVTVSARFIIKTYTVTFKDGDTVVSTQPIEHGKTVTKPGDPTKAETSTARYSFAYWYTLNNNVETKFNFNTEIISDITLYVKWTEFRKYTVEYHWWNSSTENGLIEGETEALDRRLELVNGLLISKPKSDEAWNLFFSEKLPEIYEYVDNNNNSSFYAICDGNRDIYKFVNCEILDNTIKLYYKWQGSSTNALYLY